MRFDRLITQGLVAPVRRLFRAGGDASGIPVLMYHSISADAEAGVSPYYRVCTSPARFAAQMEWLALEGYRGVSLGEALAALRDPAMAGQGRLVAITFDDGFRDFHEEAAPVLRRHGFRATMYLPTAYIGAERRRFLSRECMTWDEIRRLDAEGFEFGSHTMNHPRLVGLSWPQIEAELSGSRQCLEQELGHPVRSFAYPYAFPQADRAFKQRFTEILRGAGYQSCVTTIVGIHSPARDSFEIHRLPVNECDDTPFLHSKLTGAYNWMGDAQRCLKRIRSN